MRCALGCQVTTFDESGAADGGAVPLGGDGAGGGFVELRGIVSEGARGAAETPAVAVRRLLREGADGLPAVLATLNARTRFRFTGLYRVEPPLLRNVALFDRENPLVRAGGGCSALSDTYCSIVAGAGAPFTTVDAPTDPRLVAHAARTSVLSYVGVPVRGRHGRIEGTLCHFDSRPRLAPAGEIAVLESVAPMLADLLANARDRVS